MDLVVPVGEEILPPRDTKLTCLPAGLGSRVLLGAEVPKAGLPADTAARLDLCNCDETRLLAVFAARATAAIVDASMAVDALGIRVCLVGESTGFTVCGEAGMLHAANGDGATSSGASFL